MECEFFLLVSCGISHELGFYGEMKLRLLIYWIFLESFSHKNERNFLLGSAGKSDQNMQSLGNECQ